MSRRIVLRSATAILFVCSSVVGGSTAAGAAGTPTVAVTGDSITYLSAPAITSALAPAYLPDIVGLPGERIDEVLPALADQLAAQPSDAIVNLGTNDVSQWDTHPGWYWGYQVMVKMLRPIGCVELVTINDMRPGAITARRINWAIRETVGRQQRLGRQWYLIDWNAAIHADATLLSPDGVHPSAKGSEWIANAYRAALDDDCPNV